MYKVCKMLQTYGIRTKATAYLVLFFFFFFSFKGIIVIIVAIIIIFIRSLIRKIGEGAVRN